MNLHLKIAFVLLLALASIELSQNVIFIFFRYGNASVSSVEQRLFYTKQSAISKTDALTFDVVKKVTGEGDKVKLSLKKLTVVRTESNEASILILEVKIDPKRVNVDNFLVFEGL